MRELIEIHCNDCDGFFTVNLNLEIEGDFLFVCPECSRAHPRSVKKGELVDLAAVDMAESTARSMWKKRVYSNGEGERATRNYKEGVGERIKVPKSCYSKESRLKAIAQANKGFFARAWASIVSKEEGG